MGAKFRSVCMISLLILVIYLLVSTENCSCKCKFDWKPLCASNGKTYPSKCLFDCTKKCGSNGNITVVKDGRCNQGMHGRDAKDHTNIVTVNINGTTLPTKKPKAGSKTKTTESEFPETTEPEVTEPTDE